MLSNKPLVLVLSSILIVIVIVAGIALNFRSFQDDLVTFDPGDEVKVSDELRLKIAQRFSPILALHPDESFQPANVEILLSGPTVCGSSLWQRIEGVATLVGECLGTEGFEEHGISFSIDIDGLGISDPDAYRRRYAELKSSARNTMYSEVFGFDNLVLIDYWMFYYYNDWAGSDFFFLHEGDWERVRVAVKAHPDKATSLDPFAIMYSRHKCDAPKEMKARLWTQLPDTSRNGTHPIVFVGRGSHAGFPTNGILGTHTLVTELCASADITNHNGLRVGAQEIVLIDCVDFSRTPKNQSWLRFKGQWGGDVDSPDGPCQHSR
jgi:hypothetical protein